MTSIAIVHDWFTQLAGAEKVVEQLCQLYPSADLYAVYADPKVVKETPYLRNRPPKTTFVQRLPFAESHYRSYLPLMPLAVEQLDLAKYDLVLSSSHAVSKGVLTGPNQLHISYVHTPIRYAWDLQHQYLQEAQLNRGPKGLLARWLLHHVRIWDYRTAAGVDNFIANSQFIARRIKKVYGREADVIYPPVDVSAFTLHEDKEDFYLIASRMVPYKKMPLVVEAFSAMPDKRLIVIGEGPELSRIQAKAGSNVELMGFQPFNVLRSYLQRAKAFVFAAEEDFGIMPVEAQACGTPVIAFGRGGAVETIRPYGMTNPTGVFFDHQQVADVVTAVERFEQVESSITPKACRDNAMRFSTDRFRQEFSQYVNECLRGSSVIGNSEVFRRPKLRRSSLNA